MSNADRPVTRRELYTLLGISLTGIVGGLLFFLSKDKSAPAYIAAATPTRTPGNTEQITATPQPSATSEGTEQHLQASIYDSDTRIHELVEKFIKQIETYGDVVTARDAETTLLASVQTTEDLRIIFEAVQSLIDKGLIVLEQWPTFGVLEHVGFDRAAISDKPRSNIESLVGTMTDRWTKYLPAALMTCIDQW